MDSIICCLDSCGGGLTNAGCYQLLHDQSRLTKMNLSNVAAALVDSVIFPLLAFGVFVPSLTLTQAAMKIGGGAGWSLILVKVIKL